MNTSVIVLEPMFSIEEYFLGWCLYLLSASGLLAVFWRITQNATSRFCICQLLRLSMAVLLLTPYPVDQESSYLAPAWATIALEILFSGIDSFWRAGGPLLVIWCIITVLYCLAVLTYRVFKGIRVSP